MSGFDPVSSTEPPRLRIRKMLEMKKGESLFRQSLWYKNKPGTLNSTLLVILKMCSWNMTAIGTFSRNNLSQKRVSSEYRKLWPSQKLDIFGL